MTADVVTDQQILDLHAKMLNRVSRYVDTRDDRLALFNAMKALGRFHGSTDAERATARVRCAVILQARRSAS